MSPSSKMSSLLHLSVSVVVASWAGLGFALADNDNHVAGNSRKPYPGLEDVYYSTTNISILGEYFHHMVHNIGLRIEVLEYYWDGEGWPREALPTLWIRREEDMVVGRWFRKQEEGERFVEIEKAEGCKFREPPDPDMPYMIKFTAERAGNDGDGDDGDGDSDGSGDGDGEGQGWLLHVEGGREIEKEGGHPWDDTDIEEGGPLYIQCRSPEFPRPRQEPPNIQTHVKGCCREECSVELVVTWLECEADSEE